MAVNPLAAAGVLVADVETPDLETVLRSRRDIGARTVVWGGTLSGARARRLRDAGASAYVSALAAPRDLALTVRRVRDGDPVAWEPSAGPPAGLTPREREVAMAYLVTEAERTRAEVAHGLGISERTLKVHVARIRHAVGHVNAATREGLRYEITRRGWLD